MTLHSTFSATAARRGHDPAVVFRDHHTGERTELSYATLHNWVAKAANLLLDDLDAGLGTEVSLATPVHWLVPVVCLAAWATGAAVRADDRGDVVVGHEADGSDEVDLLIGVGMGGRPLSPDPGDALTVADILRQPDDFIDDPGDEGAWVIGGRTQATVMAERVEGGPGVRLLSAGDRVDEALVLLIARTLPAGTGLVLARGYDEAGLQRIAEQERTS